MIRFRSAAPPAKNKSRGLVRGLLVNMPCNSITKAYVALALRL